MGADGRFQMESHDSDGSWQPMQDGAAGHVWRPRHTAVAAIAKCMAWTGFLFIPEMQVRDLQTGAVIWRGVDPAGAPLRPVEHPDEADAAQCAWAHIIGDHEPIPDALPVNAEQDALF